jgi:hypothetical protein
MNKMLAAWLAITALLTLSSFIRPAYAVALYMFTFLVAPKFWWWGDLIGDYRWNFYAGILLIIALITSRAAETKREASPFSTTAAPILALMIVNAVLVHWLLAVNPDSSYGWLILRLKFILLFFLLQYAIRDEKDFRITMTSIALGIGYIGYEATINERGHFSGGRLEGIGAAGVNSANHLASLLITVLPLGLTAVFTDTKKWLKGLILAASGFAFNVVLMCNSRGAFLGLIVGGFAFLSMASGPARKQSFRILGLAAIASVLLLGDPEIIQRFLTTFNSSAQQDASAQTRIIFWTAARAMVLDYPLGSGGNSFSEGRGWQYLGRGNAVDGTRAVHNGFLTEMTDWGVQGFAIEVAFLGAVWLTLRRGRRLALATGDVNALMVFACIATALVAWLVSSFFGDYLNDEWGFWTAAFAYSYLGLRLRAPAAAPSREVRAFGAAEKAEPWGRAMPGRATP